MIDGNMFVVQQNGNYWDVIGDGPRVVSRCASKSDALAIIETWLTPDDVARKWDVSLSKLQKMRTHGDGPRYSKFGNEVRYRYASVLAYLLARERSGSSSR